MMECDRCGRTATRVIHEDATEWYCPACDQTIRRVYA